MLWIRPENWLFTQSSLKRLGAPILSVRACSSKSSGASGLIQVRNCWGVSSCSRRVAQCCQKSFMQGVSRWRGRSSDSFGRRSCHPLSDTSDMGAERRKPSRRSRSRATLGRARPAGVESDRRRIAGTRQTTNHGAAFGFCLARTAGVGARRRQNPARCPHGGVTGTLLGKKMMGDFTAKALAKRVIHRNAHSAGVSGRAGRVNPPDFAPSLHKCPANTTICRDRRDIFFVRCFPIGRNQQFKRFQPSSTAGRPLAGRSPPATVPVAYRRIACHG